MIDPSTPAGRPKRRSPWGLAAAAAGIALFVYFVERTGVADIAAGAGRLGWVFLAVVALGGLRLGARALAWRGCLDGPHRLTGRDAFCAMVAGDTLGNLTPLGLLVSEPAKTLFAGDREPPSRTLPALAVENLFFTLSAALVVAGGAMAPGAAARRHRPVVDRRRRAGGSAGAAGRRRPRGHLAAPAFRQRSAGGGRTTRSGGRHAPGLGRTGAAGRGPRVRPVPPRSPPARRGGRLGAGLPRPGRLRDLPRPRVRQRRDADPPRRVRPRIDEPPPDRRVQGRPPAHRRRRSGHRGGGRAAGVRRRRRGHPGHRAQGAHAGLDDRRGPAAGAPRSPGARRRRPRGDRAGRGRRGCARTPRGGNRGDGALAERRAGPQDAAGRGAPERAGPAAACTPPS